VMFSDHDLAGPSVFVAPVLTAEYGASTSVRGPPAAKRARTTVIRTGGVRVLLPARAGPGAD